MGNFNRDRNNRDRDRRGNDRDFNRRGSDRGFRRGGNFGRPDMHKAICDDCGQNCEVPFRPTGDKPIYCSSCFEKKGGRASSKPANRFASDRSQRPVFADRGASQPASQSKEKEILKAIKTLNYKVDQLMKVLVPETAGQEVEKEFDIKPVVLESKTVKTTSKKPKAKKKAVQKTTKKKKTKK